MKKIILLVLLLVFYSCQIEYDGDTKLVIKGIVTDQSDLPISNKEIKLFVTTQSADPSTLQIPSETNFIGNAITDSNGNYTMVIPQPKNFGQIIVETNDQNNTLNEQQFINIKLNNFINYELNLPIAKLYNKSDLTYLIIFPNQIDPSHQLLDVNFIGEIPDEIVAITPLENDTYFETSKKVMKNQTVVIEYTVKDIATNITSVAQQNIVIDNSPKITYILNY